MMLKLVLLRKKTPMNGNTGFSLLSLSHPTQVRRQSMLSFSESLTIQLWENRASDHPPRIQRVLKTSSKS